MGPRSGDRGNPGRSGWNHPAAGLQWGRDLEIAEISASASMRTTASLLQWGRDLEIAEMPLRAVHSLDDHRLQWGRDLEIAEMPLRAVHSLDDHRFQWGRDLEIAEMRPRTPFAWRRSTASMGPRSGDRGNGRARTRTT